MTIDKCLTEQELILYCSNDLSADQMRIAATHVSGCSSCARALGDIKQTLASLPQKDLKLSEADKCQFSARVMEKTKGQRTTGRLQAWGAAATAVAAGLLAVVIFNPTDLPVNKAQLQSPQMAELDLVENMEMLEVMELLEMMELLELLAEEG